jgi:hypothetical protein
MNAGSPLTNLLLKECPGVAIEVLFSARRTSVGIHRQSDKAWLTLDGNSKITETEGALGVMANMLVATEEGRTRFAPATLQDCEAMSQHLKGLLGSGGYERFLSHAPIRSRNRKQELR